MTHLHLLITHLPIFGSILGGIVLAYGLWAKSNQTIVAAYILLIISSLGAVTAYLTGEEAEEFVEKIQGFSKDLIEEHSEFAVFALIALSILGLSSLVGIFLTLKQSPMIRTAAFATLLISFISFGLIARTGYIGGQIRHTELNSPIISNSQGNDDDDRD